MSAWKRLHAEQLNILQLSLEYVQQTHEYKARVHRENPPSIGHVHACTCTSRKVLLLVSVFATTSLSCIGNSCLRDSAPSYVVRNDSYRISIGIGKKLCAASHMIRNGAYFTEESRFQLRAVSIVACEQSKGEALEC